MTARSSLERVVLSSHPAPEMSAVLFYDLEAQGIVDDLTDYSIYLADEEQLDEKTITNHSYFLRRFYAYLCAKSLDINSVSDGVLRRFRDQEKKEVLRSSKGKGNWRIANGTVNERLRRVYRWLAWLQDQGRVREGLIGRKGCAVRSTLPMGQSSGQVSKGSPAAARQQALEECPLAFRKTARHSRHRRLFVPTEEFRFSLLDRLHETASSPFLAHRNALIVDIANTVGFRRASINSLRIGQFFGGRLEESECGFIFVTPASQKFGREESFEFPVPLAERVAHFISNYLLPMARSRGWKIDLQSSPVFVSSRDGRAMCDRSITKLLSRHFRALGAPAWNATHSFRRKFANDEMDAETEYRLERGIDTSTTSISHTVSLRLGHHSPESIEPYVAAKITAPRRAASEQVKAHTAALEQEVLKLREELKRVRVLAGLSQSET